MSAPSPARATKLMSLEQLLAFRERARADGRTVVHCHGCFDIVHPGHVQHLQFARAQGDLLIVSVSADPHVAKGVDRPLIPDDLRAQNLAALECVDAVYLNPQPTAVELLGTLKPDVFIKGAEYERSVDPRFLAERNAVEGAGGRVLFSTNDIVYSSTALIGAMRGMAAFNDEKVLRYRRKHEVSPQVIANLLQRCRGLKVVVVGDYILDRYHFCRASGLAGEGPMLALQENECRDFDGGAAIVALHLARLGADPVLVTADADDEVSRAAQLRLMAAGVDVRSITNRRQSVVKNRFLADEQKLFKVDQGAPTPLDSRAEQQVAETILTAADGAALVVFTDFGYGLVTAGLLERVMPELRAKVRTITADVSGRQSNLLRFKNVDLLCPTEREVRETLQDFAGGLGAIVSKLLTETGVPQAIITLGKQGLVTCDWPGGTWEASGGRLRSEYLPALSDRAVDPMGCGDALLAATSLCLAAGASLQQAAFVGSLAAAVEVGRFGNVPVAADDVLDELARTAGVPLARAAG
jgi:rfaE bifunctional protein kinase chain/domain/rfaE bifunctional protein nucleotidyltransferase chain/domain